MKVLSLREVFVRMHVSTPTGSQVPAPASHIQRKALKQDTTNLNFRKSRHRQYLKIQQGQEQLMRLDCSLSGSSSLHPFYLVMDFEKPSGSLGSCEHYLGYRCWK